MALRIGTLAPGDIPILADDQPVFQSPLPVFNIHAQIASNLRNSCTPSTDAELRQRRRWNPLVGSLLEKLGSLITQTEAIRGRLVRYCVEWEC